MASLIGRLVALERVRNATGVVIVISEERTGHDPDYWQPIARTPDEFWPALRSREEFEAFCQEHRVVWRRYIGEGRPYAVDPEDLEGRP